MTKLIRLAFYGGVSPGSSRRDQIKKGVQIEGEPHVVGFFSSSAVDFVAIFDVTEVV